ncbi:hypothetical protein FOCC_FOCC002559 [Frankliniella occidentalis]|nr:hypothetical protein FOCC_FOCC002559 [Frankliniella occidentalis]
MSHATYNAMWREAQLQLRQLMARDQRLQRRQRETDKRGSLGWVLRLYADYIRITRTLDECHDQIVQPQKRLLVGTLTTVTDIIYLHTMPIAHNRAKTNKSFQIRRLLDGCIGRLLELKHELYTELDKSNFHYIDDLLIERRLTHEDLEIPAPRYYRWENELELQRRREFIDRVQVNGSPHSPGVCLTRPAAGVWKEFIQDPCCR